MLFIKLKNTIKMGLMIGLLQTFHHSSRQLSSYTYNKHAAVNKLMCDFYNVLL